jgi:preprotein translocase subunit SecA
MTGTADTEAYEFNEIYGLETVVIPTNRPPKRIDKQDQIYKTAKERYDAVIRDIRECYERGQPVLVGTTSIENSELLSNLLTRAGLPHEVLNAKQHAREAAIVAEAGRPKRITIATNMAGRGTDIVLGGNAEKQAALLELDESIPAEEKARRIQALHDEWQALHDQVKAAGGLHIIGTERHESRRIDNQLRGRAGRQGDPGSSRFYLSLEDPLLRIFAGDRVRAIMDRLRMPEGEAIEAGIVTRSIESAQRKVEARNFDIRKQLLEYDDVANDQRKVIYQQRNELLEAHDITETITAMRHAVITDVVHEFIPAGSIEEQWNAPELEEALRKDWQLDLAVQEMINESQSLDADDILEAVLGAADEAYEAKVALVGRESFSAFERSVMLQTLDRCWREHLAALDHLRQGIHLRGYAQQNPKQEYKREAFELFEALLNIVKTEVTRIVMNVQIQTPEQLEEAVEQYEDQGGHLENVEFRHAEFAEAAAVAAPATAAAADAATEMVGHAMSHGAHAPAAAVSAAAGGVPKVGRNDPCPCGSGKKYKQCHGKLA